VFVVLNDRDSHTHARGPSAATCLVLTSYHKIPTALIRSNQWVEVNEIALEIASYLEF
jgi:hypothetical protein